MSWWLAINPITIGAGLGLWKGTEIVEEKKEDMTRDLERIYQDIKDAQQAGELAGTQAQQAFNSAIEQIAGKYEMDIADVERVYWDTIKENVASQGETRRSVNQQIVEAVSKGERVQGATTAQLAQSGVRKTGSAANLISETARTFDIDIEEIDKRLSAEMARYGRVREAVKGQKEADIFRLGEEKGYSEERAGLQFEWTMEGITGTDLDFTKYLAGEESFIDAMGGYGWFENTLLTQPYLEEYRNAHREYREYQATGAQQDIWSSIFENARVGAQLSQGFAKMFGG